MEPEDIRFSPEHLAALIALAGCQEPSTVPLPRKSLRRCFEEDMDPDTYVEEKGLKTVNDEGALRKTIEEVIARQSAVGGGLPQR